MFEVTFQRRNVSLLVIPFRNDVFHDVMFRYEFTARISPQDRMDAGTHMSTLDVVLMRASHR